MAEHLDDFNKIITNLLNLDVKIDDEDKALLLLNYLPKSYEFLVTTLLHGIIDLEFEDVLNALMNNEVRKKDEEAYQDSSSNVLTPRGRTSTWKRVNMESPNQSREVDMKIGESLIKMSVHIVDTKAIGRKIVRS